MSFLKAFISSHTKVRTTISKVFCKTIWFMIANEIDLTRYIWIITDGIQAMLGKFGWINCTAF